MKKTNRDDKNPAFARRRPAGVSWRAALDAAPAVVLIFGGAAAFAAAPTAPVSDGGEAVAISSRASGDYIRQRLPDGSLQKETFAFARGGLWRGAEAGTKDMLDFADVARVIAGPLAGQGYLPARDPGATRLLIMVYWGTTRTPEHTTDSVANQNLAAANAAALAASNAPQMAHFGLNDYCAPLQVAQASTIGYGVRTPAQIDVDNAMSAAMAAAAAEDHQRTRLDAMNANLLGFDSWWAETTQSDGTPLQFRRRDLMDELEARRYFVVLLAYDFQMMWRQKKPKLLWETRFSVRERGRDFSLELAAMAATAASYFGRDSAKLIHASVPEGRVEVGPIKEVAFSPRN